MDTHWRNSQFFLWRKMFLPLSGCYIGYSWQYNFKNLDKYFDFKAILLFAEIAQSHLHYLSTSLVLKLLYILSTWFLTYGSFVKVVQLFRSFTMIYSMTIFRKKTFNPIGPRIQNPPFSFFCSSWSCTHPRNGSMCFSHFLVPNDKN